MFIYHLMSQARAYVLEYLPSLNISCHRTHPKRYARANSVCTQQSRSRAAGSCFPKGLQDSSRCRRKRCGSPPPPWPPLSALPQSWLQVDPHRGLRFQQAQLTLSERVRTQPHKFLSKCLVFSMSQHSNPTFWHFPSEKFDSHSP